jgi:uncharacterized membrane protein YfcA
LELIYIAAGGFVGFIIGLTGVGGGSLMTPILVLGFGITPSIAVGTDLLYAAITKANGVFFHHRNKTIDWKIAGLLASGSIPSSIITILFLEQIRDQGINYDNFMMSTLSVMLILTAIIIMIKNKLLAWVHRGNSKNTFVTVVQRFRPHITVFCGIALGFLVTISSVGAGAIGSAILFMLYPSKKPISIVGTDLAHAVPLTAIAGSGHMHFGTVDFNLLAGLLAGGIPGIYLGSFIGKRLPDNLLRPIIALLLLMMGLKLALYNY